MHDGDNKVDGEVLAFDGVSAPSTGAHMTGMKGVSLRLFPGDIGVVRVEEGRERTLLADAAQGLVTPEEGRVRFLGEDWTGMSARRQSSQRGCIRRVFEHYGWVANLDVIENLCLSELYHGSRRTADVISEAHLLARRFGLDSIPEGRPTRVHPMTLRKLEWVRAFMGTPKLILLERPLLGAPRGDMGRLVEAVCEASRYGVAILWVSDEDRDWDCGAFGHPKRYKVRDESLVAV